MRKKRTIIDKLAAIFLVGMMLLVVWLVVMVIVLVTKAALGL